MQIFIINGNAGCGKTTFGLFVAAFLKDKGVPFLHDSSVKPVKDFLLENKWEGKQWDGITKDDYWRRAMHECKCWMIEQDQHVFDKYALKKIREIDKDTNSAVLFFDIREPENIIQLVKYIQKQDSKIKVFSVFVQRDSDCEFNNYADTNQTNYEYDIYLENNGDLDNLYKNAEKFVEKYIAKVSSKSKKPASCPKK